MKEFINKIFKIEIIRYGMVGVLSTALDYLFLNLSHTLMGGANQTLGWATAIGFCVGLVNGYYFNSRWTFKYNTKGQEGKKFGQFAIISLVGLALTEIIVLYFANNVGHDKNIAKLIAVIIVFFWNFFGNKMWTFQKRAGTGTE
jgi:putative flippase GtrA